MHEPRSDKRRFGPLFIVLVLAGASTLAVLACDHLVSTNHGGPRDGGGGSGGIGGGGVGGTVDAPPDDITDGAPPPDGMKMSCGDSQYSDPWSPGYTPDPNVQSMARATVGAMTLSEKADQMRGTNPGNLQNFSDIFRTLDNSNK